MFWSCYFIQNAFLRSFFLTNLVKTEVGFKWRINLEALENNLSEVSGFPTDFPHQEFYGKTLFVGGAKSDYVRWVLPWNYCKIRKIVWLYLSLVFENARPQITTVEWSLLSTQITSIRFTTAYLVQVYKFAECWQSWCIIYSGCSGKQIACLTPSTFTN